MGTSEVSTEAAYSCSWCRDWDAEVKAGILVMACHGYLGKIVNDTYHPHVVYSLEWL